MDSRHMPALSLFAAFVAISVSATNVSDPIMVTSCSEKSLLWNTVTHSTETIQLEWPESAASAQIAMSTGRTIELSDKTVTSVQVEFGRPQDAVSERLIDLVLTFFGSDGQPLADATRTAQLGWVRGCGTDEFDLRPSDMSAASWSGMPIRGILFLGGDIEAFSTNGVDVAVGELPQPWWFRPVFPASRLLATVLASADGTQFSRTILGISQGLTVTFR